MNQTTRLGLVTSLCFLTGCAGTALHHTFGNYSEVYAECMNEQLLLNLARASCNEPPYFVQLGQMNATFTFKSGSSFSPTHTANSPAGPVDKVGGLAKEVLTLGGSVTAELTEQPVFNFVPLSGEQFAAAINNPIPEKLFLTLYSQGFHADILVRVLVTSVQVSDSPGRQNILVNHPNDPTYLEFLQFCDELRQWQLHHQLVVENVPAFNPTSYRDVKLTDTIAGLAAGIAVANAPDGSNFVASTSRENFRFRFLTNRVEAESKDPTTHEASVGKRINNASNVFQMRTFLSTLYAVAREENYFKQNQFKQIANPKDSGDGLKYIKDGRGYGATNNSLTIRPILALTGLSAGSSANNTLLNLEHNGQSYAIEDSKDEFDQPNHRVFSLLSALFADVSIDPQKLPVQQLIQIH